MPADSASNNSLVNESRIVPFDSHRHAGLGVNPSRLSHFMATRNAFTINLTEFFYASQHYPLVFVKSGESAIQACAITGLRQEENLFVDERGNWRDQTYVPAYVRRYPFYTLGTQGSSSAEKLMIMVDENGLSESENSFFDTSGQATDQWQKTQNFIADYISAEKLTFAFTAKIAELGLLEAFEAQVNPQLQKRMQVTGMYRINEDRLNRLSTKVIKDLMIQGELSRIYAHLISLENFAKLLDLSVSKDKIATI